MNEGSENKNPFDPSFNAADFKTQVLGGSLRWLATVLTVASLGLLAYFLISKEQPQLDFPIHLSGVIVYWFVGSFVLIWLLLAIKNWISWFKKKRG